jgi:predicted metal-binding protein
MRNKPENFPSISVIIPARNEEKSLLLLLKDLSAQSLPVFEIFCVDDASKDASWCTLNYNSSSKIGEKMDTKTKIGIIICDRYRKCAGGKCLRALRNREGAFSTYAESDMKLVGYTTCDGCPGGNIEYAGEEMVKNSAQVIHLATGLLVGYPPCPYIETFKNFLEKRYNVKVVLGTHPIPQKYLDMHIQLGSWEDPYWNTRLAPTMVDETVRKAYN